MNKAYLWALALLVAAPQLWGQAELVRDFQPGTNGSRPLNLVEHRDMLHMLLAYTNHNPDEYQNYLYNPQTNEWTSVAFQGPIPTAYFPYALLKDGNMLYGFVYDDLLRLNLDNQRYELLEITPSSDSSYRDYQTTTSAIVEDIVRYDRPATCPTSYHQTLRVYDIHRNRWQYLVDTESPNSSCFNFYLYGQAGDYLLSNIQTPLDRYLVSFELSTGQKDTIPYPDQVFFWPSFSHWARSPVTLNNKIYLGGKVSDSGNYYRSSDELFVYTPGSRQIKQLTQSSVPSYEGEMSGLGFFNNSVLVAKSSSSPTQPAFLIAYDPALDRSRKIAELTEPLNKYTISRFHRVRDQLYAEAKLRPGQSGLPNFRLCRIHLPITSLFSDSLLYPVELINIPQIPLDAQLTFPSMGSTANWLYLIARLPSTHNNTGYEDALFALHVPSQRWFTTLRMSPSVGSGIVYYRAQPVEVKGDLYFSGVGDRVGEELFRFRADGTTSTEPLLASDANRFRLSPNPTVGPVRLAGPEGDGALKYRLLNTMGQEIAGGSADRAEAEAQLSRILSAAAPGLYVVNLTVGGRSEVHRVLRASN